MFGADVGLLVSHAVSKTAVSTNWKVNQKGAQMEHLGNSPSN